MLKLRSQRFIKENVPLHDSIYLPGFRVFFYVYECQEVVTVASNLSRFG